MKAGISTGAVRRHEGRPPRVALRINMMDDEREGRGHEGDGDCKMKNEKCKMQNEKGRWFNPSSSSSICNLQFAICILHWRRVRRGRGKLDGGRREAVEGRGHAVEKEFWIEADPHDGNGQQYERERLAELQIAEPARARAPAAALSAGRRTRVRSGTACTTRRAPRPRRPRRPSRGRRCRACRAAWRTPAGTCPAESGTRRRSR